jgi:uncharacterized protein YuzE
MKVIYDRETDSLLITLREAPIRETDEARPGVIVDFGRTPSGCNSPLPADSVNDS